MVKDSALILLKALNLFTFETRIELRAVEEEDPILFEKVIFPIPAAKVKGKNPSRVEAKLILAPPPKTPEEFEEIFCD